MLSTIKINLRTGRKSKLKDYINLYQR